MVAFFISSFCCLCLRIFTTMMALTFLDCLVHGQVKSKGIKVIFLFVLGFANHSSVVI